MIVMKNRHLVLHAEIRVFLQNFRAIYGLKALRISFTTQQTVRQSEFCSESYEFFTTGCQGRQF